MSCNTLCVAEALELLATDNALSRSLLKRLIGRSEEHYACALNLLQLHALLCANDTEKSPGRQAAGGVAKGPRGDRAPDTTLQSLLLKALPTAAPSSVAASSSAPDVSSCVASTPSNEQQQSGDQNAASRPSPTAATSADPPRALLPHSSVKLSQPLVAVVQSVFGGEFVPMREHERTSAALPSPCCRLAISLNLADLIIQYACCTCNEYMYCITLVY